MDCETESLFSLAESGAASSCNATEISQLQNEILKQSRQIQKFIQSNESAHGNDSSFVVLKSLFALFKSELSVNLALRKHLVDEKKLSESMEEQIEVFFSELREIGYEAEDFAGVLALLKKQSSRMRKLTKVAKQLNEETRRNDEMRLEEADRSVQIATLNAQLDQANTEIAVANKQNRELSLQIEAASAERQRIEESVDKFAQEMRALQERISTVEQEKTQMAAKFAEKRDKMNLRMQDAGEKVELLTKQISELRAIHEQEVADVRRKCKAKVKEALRSRKDLQSETQKTVDELKASLESVMVGIREDRQREAEEIREAHKEEMEAMRQRHQAELAHVSAEMEKARAAAEERNGQIGELKAMISQMEVERSGDSEAETASKQKFKRLMKKMQALKTELDRITEMHNAEMERVEKEREKKEEEIRASVEASYAAAINKYKLIERELGFQVNEQQIENKRLRDQLRQYSYILEKKEAQLAHLQTQLASDYDQGAMKRTRGASPKKTRRRHPCEDNL